MNLKRLDRQNKSSDCKLPVLFEEKEIIKFARRHWRDGNRWNGRQIKNAFQTAAALADWDNLNNLRENAGPENKPSPPRLERKHFETVALASAQFDKYLVRVRSSD